MTSESLMRIFNLIRGILACVAALIAIQSLVIVGAVEDVSLKLVGSLGLALSLSWPYSLRVLIFTFAGAGVVGITALLLNLRALDVTVDSVLTFAIIKIAYLFPFALWLVANRGNRLKAFNSGHAELDSDEIEKDDDDEHHVQ